MSECVFCDVVAGELEALVIAEDTSSVAFLDWRPAARGHTLVVPRTHVENMWDGDADTVASVMRTAHDVAATLRERLRPDGLTLRANTGEASGQKVAHLHLHLVPRWHGDGTVGWPWPPPQDLDLRELHRLLAR